MKESENKIREAAIMQCAIENIIPSEENINFYVNAIKMSLNEISSMPGVVGQKKAINLLVDFNVMVKAPTMEERLRDAGADEWLKRYNRKPK